MTEPELRAHLFAQHGASEDPLRVSSMTILIARHDSSHRHLQEHINHTHEEATCRET